MADLPRCCPLCGSDHLTLFCRDKRREYFRCRQCALVSVPATMHLTATAEKAEYDKHNNQLADAGYQAFLRRTWDPLLACLRQLQRPLTHIRGLDFGCGEGAVLSQVAAQDGVRVANYDLYYHPGTAVLQEQYDFITLTEVIEHIADAAALVRQLDALLKPGGWLAVMTKRVLDQDAFSRWHYKNDPTHICFYSDDTFEWLAERLGWHCELSGKDVVLLRKPAAPDCTAPSE
ncbi:class I SAM-dependent methyltransferase [Shewanella sp. GXUN23E]|uniref:class I SAM-dependent methyltransferase n=1 Tax=Shewanella sp. GXUN23E TaxID=3422498 RepID=UPI003D7C77E1